MDYKSLFTDIVIAEYLGLELVGSPLNDLTATARISQFRSNIVESLEEELAKAEKDYMLKVAKDVSFQSLLDAIKVGTSDDRLSQGLYTFIQVDTTDQGNGDVKLNLGVSIYSGRRDSRQGFRAPQDRSDANYIKHLLESVKRTGIDSIDGLYIERQGFPRISALQPPVVSPAGHQLSSTHLVTVNYVALIPESMLPEVYAIHGPKATAH